MVRTRFQLTRQAEADRWPRRPLLWLVAALVVAAFLQCYRLWFLPLWLDEIITKWIASSPNVGVVIERARIPAIGPFYYLLAHVAQTAVPSEAFAIRALSVAFGLASVALFYVVGTVLIDRAFGAFVSMAAALEATVVYAGRDARPYSLALMGALLAAWGFLRWRGGGRRTWLILYIAGMAILVQANYVFGLILGAFGLFVLIAGAPPRSRVRAVVEFAVASAILGLALIPLLPNLRFASQNAHLLQAWNKRTPALDAPFILGRLALVCFVAYGAALAFTFLGRGGDAGAGRPARGRVREVALLGLLWYGAPLVGIVVLYRCFGLNLWDSRYFTVYVGGPLLLAALPTVLADRRTRFPLVYGVVVLVLLAAGRASDYRTHGTLSQKRDRRMKAMVEKALDEAASSDLILFQTCYVVGDLLGSADTGVSDEALADYVLAPVHVYAAAAPPVPVLPLPNSDEVAPFEQYYDAVVGPAIAKSRTLVLVSLGVAPSFEEWLARVSPDAGVEAELGPWKLEASYEFGGDHAVRRYSRRAP